MHKHHSLTLRKWFKRYIITLSEARFTPIVTYFFASHATFLRPYYLHLFVLPSFLDIIVVITIIASPRSILLVVFWHSVSTIEVNGNRECEKGGAREGGDRETREQRNVKWLSTDYRVLFENRNSGKINFENFEMCSKTIIVDLLVSDPGQESRRYLYLLKIKIEIAKIENKNYSTFVIKIIIWKLIVRIERDIVYCVAWYFFISK